MKYFWTFLSWFIVWFADAQNQNKAGDELLDTLQIVTHGISNTMQRLPKTIRVIKARDIQQSAVESIDDVLNLVAGIDMRSRGSKGVQSDISIRGGNFDQVLVLLNGVRLNNPQTGHHVLDLPIDLSMIDRIEILEGASGQSFGVNAYSGAINFITKKPEHEQAYTQFNAGQYNYLKTDFGLSHRLGKISVYNGFTYQRSGGYLTNTDINNTDFYTIKDFVNLHFDHERFPLNLQAGYHQKDFGANSFYTAKYPWQFEKTHGYFISLFTKTGKKFVLKPEVHYKLHYDEFQLFRESVYQYRNGFFIHDKDTAQYAPGVYYKGHNYHKTQNAGGGLNMSIVSKYGHTYINLSIENERIWSNKLGEDLPEPIRVDQRIVYTKSDSRTYFEAQLNQVKQWQKIAIGAGLNVLYSRQYDLQMSGGAYINYRQAHMTHYFNINSAYRLPTFTDLYYQGPANMGNPALQPEQAVTYELGTKYFDLQNYITAAVFLRNANNTIDWIKYRVKDKWQPQNLTRLQTYGLEVSWKHRFNKGFIKKAALSYAFLYMEKGDNEQVISKYVLDYLKHKFNISLSHRFLFDTNLQWTAVYKNREGQYLNYIDNQYRLFDYKPYAVVNLKLNKEIGKSRLGLSIENLFDVKYNDLSYVQMPGRWIIFEWRYRIIPKRHTN